MRDKTTGEISEVTLKISEREKFLEDNANLEQMLSAPPQGDSVRLGIRRVDSSFNDVLSKAKNAHYKSTIQY